MEWGLFRQGARTAACACIAVLSLSATAALGLTATAGAAAHTRSPSRTAVTPRTGDPLPGQFSSLESLYLTDRPPLGAAVHVVDIGTQSFDVQLLAESLAGIVNHTSAQIYILQGDPATDQDRQSAQFWLDEYQREGLVTVAATDTITSALTSFTTAYKGYVLADTAEPWTVNAATTLASVDQAVIATDATKSMLDGLGIPEIIDLHNKWPDAPTSYAAMQSQYAATMPSRALGMVDPTQSRLRDFLIEQGIFTMYARAQAPDWARELPVMRAFPSGVPVFGYIATNGVEEFSGTLELSQEGKVLVPSDTVQNLSFHVAVRGGQSAPIAALPSNPRPCRPGETDVIPAITDGDNLAVESIVYARADEWRSSLRGTMPMGWSVSPTLSFLAPGIWHYYVSTRSPSDELVAMMGMGYVFPSAMPAPSGPSGATGAQPGTEGWFYGQSFALMSYLGLRSYWSLDLGLGAPTSTGYPAPWSTLTSSSVGGDPASILLSYIQLPGPQQFLSPGGVPSFSPVGSTYNDTLSQLTARVSTLAFAPPSVPTASFLPIPIWNFSVDQLDTGLSPLATGSTRYVTPSQAAACVAGNTTVVGGARTPDGKGYWMTTEGGVDYSFGDAQNYGIAQGIPSGGPVVGVAPTHDGAGYWLAGVNGAVYGFGDASYFGSMGGVALSAPVAGIAATPDGKGYWFVGADGGVYAFGDASYFGSMGGVALSAPVAGIAATPDGKGYWFVGADGGVFAFGDAPVLGGLAGTHLSAPVSGIVPTPDGKGYWLVGADGGAYGFGDALYYGSVPGL